MLAADTRAVINEATPAAPESFEFSPALGAVAEPTAKTAVAFRQIASEVINRHARLGRRGLAICGASSGTGTSYVALNLAVALAQMGTSTLLVDANLRAPTFERFIRPTQPGPGLQQLLRSAIERRHVVHEDVLPDLSVIYSGGPALDADELLGGSAFDDALRALMRDYDCVILDTPPANRSADACIVAAAAGYALIVGRDAHTYLDDASELSQQLSQHGVTVVGAVFNEA